MIKNRKQYLYTLIPGFKEMTPDEEYEVLKRIAKDPEFDKLVKKALNSSIQSTVVYSNRNNTNLSQEEIDNINRALCNPLNYPNLPIVTDYTQLQPQSNDIGNEDVNELSYGIPDNRNNNVFNFLFDNNNVHVIRDDDGRKWFYANEIAKILGYSSAHDMIRKLPKEEVCKVKINDLVNFTGSKTNDNAYQALLFPKGRGGPQYLSLISLEGLFKIIMRASVKNLMLLNFRIGLHMTYYLRSMILDIMQILTLWRN